MLKYSSRYVFSNPNTWNKTPILQLKKWLPKSEKAKLYSCVTRSNQSQLICIDEGNNLVYLIDCNWNVAFSSLSVVEKK